MAIPVVDLGAANYGEGTCTQWDEHVEEHLELDEDDREHSTYSMVCDGAERVRALVTKALAPDPVQVRAPDAPLSVAPLWCPWCGLRHVDEGEFATRLHHTHRCVAVGGCGREWRLETYVSGAPVSVGASSSNPAIPYCDVCGEEGAGLRTAVEVCRDCYDAARSGVEAEREACAKIVDDYDDALDSGDIVQLGELARVLRARGIPDVVTCGACGQTPCSCAPDCKCGRPSCGGQCEPE